MAGPASERLAELQLTLGQGPCHDVLASAAPVLAADLGEEEASRRWPAFTPEAFRLGARAVFAFPLAIGVIRAGTMGLYCASPGSLPAATFGDTLLLADIATMLLPDSAEHGADGSAQTADGATLEGQSPELALHRTQIDQATGMLAVQPGTTPAAASARLRTYAYAHDRQLGHVASDILARRLRLPHDPAREQ